MASPENTNYQRYPHRLWDQFIPSVSGKTGHECEFDRFGKDENFIYLYFKLDYLEDHLTEA